MIKATDSHRAQSFLDFCTSVNNNMLCMLQASTCSVDMQRLCFCHEVEEAEQIYLLMKEEYRISRNVRLAWFLGKLNQVIRPASKPELVRKSCLLSLFLIRMITHCRLI